MRIPPIPGSGVPPPIPGGGEDALLQQLQNFVKEAKQALRDRSNEEAETFFANLQQFLNAHKQDLLKLRGGGVELYSELEKSFPQEDVKRAEDALTICLIKNGILPE